MISGGAYYVHICLCRLRRGMTVKCTLLRSALADAVIEFPELCRRHESHDSPAGRLPEMHFRPCSRARCCCCFCGSPNCCTACLR